MQEGVNEQSVGSVLVGSTGEKGQVLGVHPQDSQDSAPARGTTLKNADRINLLESTITFVRKYQITPAGRQILLDIAEDNYGEKYVEVTRDPEKQRFVGLLMKPVCGLADIVRDRNEVYTADKHGVALQGKPIHYSHMVDLSTIEPRTEQELRAEMFLMATLTSDRDHNVIKKSDEFGVSGISEYGNAVFSDSRYYMFDFNAAFLSPKVFDDEATEDAMTRYASVAFSELFKQEDADAVMPLLREKILSLRSAYDSEDGYRLFIAQLKESGISDDLQEIFGTQALQQWSDPINGFYEHFLLRIRTLEKFVENYTGPMVQPQRQAAELVQAGRYNEAIAIFRELKPEQIDNQVWYRADLGQALLRGGEGQEWEEARQLLEEGKRLADARGFETERTSVRLVLAQVYGRLGRYEDSLKEYEEVAEIGTGEKWKQEEIAFLTDIEGERRQATADRLQKEGSKDIREGRYEEGMVKCEKALALVGEEKEPWAIADKGMALLREGKHREARVVLIRTAIVLPRGNQQWIQVGIGRSEELEGNLEEAKKAYEMALEINPANTEAREDLERVKQELAGIIPLEIDSSEAYIRWLKRINFYPAEDSYMRTPEGRMVHEDGSEIIRDVERERQHIEQYLSGQEGTYRKIVEQYASQLAPMDADCRVAIQIPAYLEERNIYHTLEEWASQVDNKGAKINPDLYEIDIIVNGPQGYTKDDTAAEIRRFKRDHPGIKINVIEIEVPDPKGNVGYVRKLMTDIALKRSVDRSSQTGPLYIESEDADLMEIDKRAIYRLIKKFDEEPYIDALRGKQDLAPGILMENDYLFLDRRLERFIEYLFRDHRLRPENNPNFDMFWNRVITGGWNTAFTAEAYAMIGGYQPVPVGEDVEIGRRISIMRGKTNTEGRFIPNVHAIGRVHNVGQSNPRRFIHALLHKMPAYADFDNPQINQEIRTMALSEMMSKLEFGRRIDESNVENFEELLTANRRFLYSKIADPVMREELFSRLMMIIGFKRYKEVPQSDGSVVRVNGPLKQEGSDRDEWRLDYHVEQDGTVRIDNIGNIKEAFEFYRKRYVSLQQRKGQR